MGIGFDFGPPRADLRVPSGREPWFSDRALSAEQMAELVRAVESWGGAVAESSDGSFSIEGEHDAFVVGTTGGYLSKPNVGGEDEYDRLWQLLTSVCDWAGWIVVGESIEFGARIVCAKCGGEGDPCPNGHGAEHLRMALEVSPPEEPAPRPTAKLDAVRAATNARELRSALAALGGPPPHDDADVATALLLSDDDDVLAATLDGLERLAGAGHLRRTALLDTRLRKIEMLGEEPSLVGRARALRGRLR